MAIVCRSIFVLTMPLLACGQDPVPASLAEDDPGESPIVIADDRPRGDALLDDARRGIRGGVLPEELRAAVLGSADPAHARAKRVLLAMDERPEETLDALADDQEATVPPPILPPSETTPPPIGSKTPPESPPSRGPAQVGKLALRSSKRGATLTIKAPSSLVVGVVHQPASGIVRLVIESARAGGSVLGARPKLEGAEVTAVRQGQGTVVVTLQLDPGWTLGSVDPFSGGAKVHLRAPAGR